MSSDQQSTVRGQLLAAAVHDVLIILDDLSRRKLVDAGKVLEVRWLAVRVTGEASADETARFWSHYAELVVLTGCLERQHADTLTAQLHQGPLPLRRIRSKQVAVLGAAIAAGLCAVLFLTSNSSPLVAPENTYQPVAAALDSFLPIEPNNASRLTASPALAAEPAYYITYGRDHPDFPQPLPPPTAHFDPPQAEM